ncbi:hypothetical protein M436DRAFT_44771 [Aureobasidium namibiae CBS 147.97]|uniref:Uncharacterized protein n=1 Tax=Aureobasidium namibiae CBS 147.97 TaxID=1043004 RepID=A0A074WLX0_9PEZI|nr:uncharacterized protein M436DRAFT_44771 [Aureobasidium namibiae CBS 147.97]KEQ74103.1 hypothetical protein M436DRAFT_44771 [Aureobasidium namibiae CBS 147.97]
MDHFVQSQKDPQGTVVAIKAGDGAGASNTLVSIRIVGLRNANTIKQGGKISQVYAYNAQNVKIGSAGKQTMAGNGDYLSFTVDQNVPGSQGQYIGIQNSKDATCVAWITVQSHDNTPNGVWTGDIGRMCGQTWFENQEQAGYLQDGTPYRPSCTWLDAGHDSDIPSASMKFAAYAYGGELSHATLEDACAYTIFAHDEGEITSKSSGRSNLLPRARLPWMETKLVISNIATHSATNLCNSATSWGPDFATLNEGKLCDMSTKTLYTLCSKENVDGCVDISTASGNGTATQPSVAMRKVSVAKRTVNSSIRSYEDTAIWGDDN